jgi:hypothetical protein
MEIKEAYKNQLNLESRISNADYEAHLADSDTDRDAILAKASEYEAELAALQAEVGGYIARIPSENLPALEKRINRYIKQAEKNGAPTPVFNITDETDEETKKENGRSYIHTYRFVIAAGDPPSLEGWTFVATLDHSLDETVIRTAPGQEVDLSAYRNADPTCDHCNRIRSRKDTYIVKHEDGTIKQVGRTCLQDFISTLTPARIVNYFNFLRELRDTDSEFYEAKGERVYDPITYLSHVACVIREYGWTSASQAYDYGNIATKQAAADNLYDQENQRKDKQGSPLWTDPSDEDRELAVAALETARAIDPDSDFDHNLKAIASANHWTYRHLGIAAYIVQHHKRQIEKQVKQELHEQRVQASTNEHFGEIKDRLELCLTVTAIHEIENHFSYGASATYITTFEDSEGRKFKWFGSYPLEVGETLEGRWTIKKHDEYKGIKETVITRPHSLEIVETV